MFAGFGEVIHGKFERLPPNADLIPANGRGQHHSYQLIKDSKVMFFLRDTSQVEIVISY